MQVADWLESARLWLVLDKAAASPRGLAEVAGLCLQGGVDAVLFRMKDADEAEFLGEAARVQAVCRAEGAPFIVSHNATVARQLEADGVQLGVADPPIGIVRKHTGAMAIGYSAHSLSEMKSVAGQGADYVFMGPVFHTPSKAGMGTPLGTDLVSATPEHGMPVVWIGGINEQNLPLVIQAGGRRVAAIRALQSVDDPKASAARLKALLSSAH